MNTPNFNDMLVRCSSIGAIMTEPQAKADKDAGNLSATAIDECISIYSRQVDGRFSDIYSPAVIKGNRVEEDSLTLLSTFDKSFYGKNKVRLHNKWITGECDVHVPELRKIIDIKSSWTNETYLKSIMKPLVKDYYWQGQGYCWLYDCDVFEIAFCLVNAPDEMVESEKRKFLYSIGNPSEFNEDIHAKLQQIERNMRFDDIPMQQRVYKHVIARNDEDIARISAKVEKVREQLQVIYNRRNHIQ